jgi:spore coat polysaccharide biosynthesis protein SpsF
VAREHVTGYFKLHPDFVRIARAPAYPPLAREGGRLTVDTPDDLAFVESLHERLHAAAGEASLADLLELLEREPALRAANAHVRQKPLDGRQALALIRCDGGGGFGYGHVKRMVALARALRDREGIGAVFAVNGTADALEPIRAAGFDAVRLDSRTTLSGLVTRRKPDLLVCDLREGLSAASLAQLSARVGLTAVIDDGSERRLVADVAYFPPVPQALALSWEGSACRPRIGWDWAILGTNRTGATWGQNSNRLTLLVSMGGSDPQGLTLQCAQALAPLEPAFRARFVIGPGVEDAARISKSIVGLAPHFETLEGADGLSTEFASADLALAAFGVTAYELAAYGVPAIYLSLTEDHARSAAAFEAAGMGVSLGVSSEVAPGAIADSVSSLLADSLRRRAMRKAGLSTIDGDGANRVAADLAAALAERRNAAPLRKAL